MEEASFREIIASLVESIESGKKLSQAMSEHPNAFDKITVSLTRAGEDSGRLVEVFAHLTESLKWQDEMASQTKGMMIYPLFVGTVVLAITFFPMIYLVPQLVGFIKGMGQEIPIQTRILLATSSFFVNYWYAILLTPPVLFGIYRVALISNPGLQYHLDNLKLHVWQKEEVVGRAGEVLTIPSNLPHKALALGDTLDVDVFSPPRQDWLDGTDAYLRGR